MKNVLFIYTNFSTFVKKDYYFLNQKMHVDKYHFKTGKDLFVLCVSLLKQFWFLILNINKYRKVYIWFSDYHSVLPVLFSKMFGLKSYLIIGGYDVTGIPQISYGIFYSNRFRKYCNKISIQFANYILPVDDSLIKGINSYCEKNSNLPVGIKHIVPQPKGKIITVPTGYDITFGDKAYSFKREKSVLSVAVITNRKRWILKGGDFLVDIARITPEVNFHFFGLDNDFIIELQKDKLPSNFFLHGYIKNDELENIYSKHLIYAQFSLSEGLPNVLCEAMLCECIPVGSNVNGIPQAIGNTGYILNINNIEKAKKLILQAINSDKLLGAKARERIIEKFDENKRKSLLETILNDPICD